jgi:hypothetical protein
MLEEMVFQFNIVSTKHYTCWPKYLGYSKYFGLLGFGIWAYSNLIVIWDLGF